MTIAPAALPPPPARRLLVVAALLATACGGEGAPAAAPPTAASQPPAEADIWLATLTSGADGAVGITGATNVTNRMGYDNQPTFLPDGSGFLYTVIDDAGQADIWRYDLDAGYARQVTRTAPESEYSATPLEGTPGFSAVRVEADSTQRLWRFAPDGSNPSVLFADIAPVGYHAWADAETAVLYVLGDPPVLDVARLGGGAPTEVARDVGRSLQRIPGSHDVSFVQHVDGGTEIRRLHVDTGASELLVKGVEGGDFHAWTPDGALLQAHEGIVYAWRPGEEGWSQIADLSALGIRITRMAVSPDGSRIALVGESGS